MEDMFSEDEYWDSSSSFDSDDANEVLQKVQLQEHFNKLMLEKSQKVFAQIETKIMEDMIEFEKTLDRIEKFMDEAIDHANTKKKFICKMKQCATLANRNYNTMTRTHNDTNKKGVNTNEFNSVLSQMTYESWKVLETLESIVAKMNTK
jgi:hypothetical protein